MSNRAIGPGRLGEMDVRVIEHRDVERCKLFWVGVAGQALPMGEYSTEAEARAAIPGALAEMIEQCGPAEEPGWIHDGSWEIQIPEAAE